MSTKRFHEPRCKVCQSSHRDEYERLWKEGTSFHDLEDLAKEKYDENISFMSFSRHMTKHMIFDKLQVTSGKKIEEEVQGTLNILDSLKGSLKELEDTIQLGIKVFTANPSPTALNAIANALHKKRTLLASIEQLSRQLSERREGLSEEELLQEMVWGTEILCKKCSKKLVGRLMTRLEGNAT